MKARGWVAYLAGGILFNSGFPGTGFAVFGIGILVDWKIWLLGIAAFIIGFNWK